MSNAEFNSFVVKPAEGAVIVALLKSKIDADHRAERVYKFWDRGNQRETRMSLHGNMLGDEFPIGWREARPDEVQHWETGKNLLKILENKERHGELTMNTVGK